MYAGQNPLELKIEGKDDGYILAVKGGAVGCEKHCTSGLMLIKDIISVLLHWQSGL